MYAQKYILLCCVVLFLVHCSLFIIHSLSLLVQELSSSFRLSDSPISIMSSSGEYTLPDPFKMFELSSDKESLLQLWTWNQFFSRKKCSGCAAFTTFFFCFSRIRATSWMITHWIVLIRYRSVSPIKVRTHVNKYNLYSIFEPPCTN